MNFSLVLNFSGSGGRVAVVPRARAGLGGDVARRDRACDEGRDGSENMWTCGLEERVESARDAVRRKISEGVAEMTSGLHWKVRSMITM